MNLYFAADVGQCGSEKKIVRTRGPGIRNPLFGTFTRLYKCVAAVLEPLRHNSAYQPQHPIPRPAQMPQTDLVCVFPKMRTTCTILINDDGTLFWSILNGTTLLRIDSICVGALSQNIFAKIHWYTNLNDEYGIRYLRSHGLRIFVFGNIKISLICFSL